MPQLADEDRDVALREGLIAAHAIAYDMYRAWALAAFLTYVPNSDSCLRAIRHAMVDHLEDLVGKERKAALEFCADKRLFAPPILSPTTLAAIARHIIEICQEWQWL